MSTQQTEHQLRTVARRVKTLTGQVERCRKWAHLDPDHAAKRLPVLEAQLAAAKARLAELVAGA